MQNFYKKGYNPIVETMNNNYLNTYGNYNDGVEQPQNLQQNNSNSTDNQQKAEQSSQNINNMGNLLNMLGGNNAQLDLVKNILGGNSNLDKNQLLMNLMSNLQKSQNQSTKKTTTLNSSDFSTLTNIDDYNFVD